MIKTYEEALSKIFVIEESRDYSLERIFKAMDLLGNPLKNIKVIHVAGTNGKGSVSRMVYSCLILNGDKVGTYNQPHIVDIKERFLANNQLITEKEFVNILNQILDLPLTFSYFEKTTLMAFLFFQKRKVEYAIVEVGFGGLLDSTNVVDPFITAITSIGYDHMKILGNTLEEISFQKAGIIKKGIPIVYNHKNDVIEKIAKEKDAPVIFTNKKIETNLNGEHQRKNAGIAYEVCKYIGINDNTLFKGLKNVEHNGRLEYIKPNLLIDGAHNKDGLKELKKYIYTIKGNFKEINYCFALKHGKEPKLILDIFGNNKKYTLVQSSHKILESEEAIIKYFKNKNILLKKGSSKEIISKSENEKNHLFVVFGSLYMIGEFYK